MPVCPLCPGCSITQNITVSAFFSAFHALCYHLLNGAVMTERLIDVRIFPRFRRALSTEWLINVAEAALAAGLPPPGVGFSRRNMSLVVADDVTVQELNRDYRGLDETTDVLAFSSQHWGHYEGEDEPKVFWDGEPFVTPEGHHDFVGEVIISYPQCQRQADARGRNVEDELALLITHGVLHLLGYDHMEPEEEREMQALEEKALAAVGLAEAGR